MIKTTIVSLFFAGMLCTSGQTQSSVKKAAPLPQGLPATAEKVSEGVWKWKDPQGQAWVYHRTAFGYSRTADLSGKPEDSTTAGAQAGLRVVEVKAGVVTFEQPTPFGKSRWDRAVAEMNGDEKAAYESYQKSTKPAAAAK